MRHRPTSSRLIAMGAVLALTLAACGPGAEETTTTAGPGSTTIPETTTTGAETTTTASETTTTSATTTTPPQEAGRAVYFLLDDVEGGPGPYLVPVYREGAGGDEAETVMNLLLEGPSQDEIEGLPAISTAIPEGTTLLGVEVEDGVAAVDLSEQYDDGGGSFSVFARLAQVVFTLTRLPEIDSVVFYLEGEEVTVFSAEGIELSGAQARDDYYDLLPAVFVESPAWGEPVQSPVTVTGLSNVFEAVSQVMLTDDDGAPLFEETVMASCGTGCWGEWEVEIPYTLDREQFGSLIVWVNSAEDGRQIDVREYPVVLR